MSRNAFSNATSATKSALSEEKPSTTLSVRLSWDERQRLEELAGDRPVSAFVRTQLFGRGGARKSNARRATSDNAALARVLAALGRSGLAADLGAIVWAADKGKLQLDKQSLKRVRLACDDVAAIRHDIIIALGLKAR